MPFGDAPFGERSLNFNRESQEPHFVRHRAPAFSDFLGNLLLREIEFFNQFFVGPRFFKNVQVLALDIFDERDLKFFPLPRFFPDNHRNHFESGDFGRFEAPLTRDQLILLRRDFHRYKRLDDAVLFDGISQFLQFLSQFLEQILPQLGMAHLPPSEHYGNFYLGTGV